MRGSQTKSRLPTISIAASTPKIDVDNRFPLSKYYRAADNLLKQAYIYREERNILDLYVLLLRFCSLVGETIPEHRDYRTSPAKTKSLYREKLDKALAELERLKPEAQNELIRQNNKLATAASVYETNANTEFEWPSAYNRVLKNNGQNNQVIVPNRMLHSNQTELGQLQDYLGNLSISLPPPKFETLSRHSFLGQSGLRAPVDVPYSQTKVQYPSYPDASFSETSSLKQSISEAVPVVQDSSLKTLESAFFEMGPDLNEVDLTSQLSLIHHQPSPPPVSVSVQNMPTIPSISVGHIPPSRVADPFPGPGVVNQGGEGLKQVYICAKMMDEFLRLAKENTIKNLETCGVLAGSLRKASFYVTALIIPKQEATSDSCQTVNEEEIFSWQDERNLFQLGWIHTHPKQSCFMSSIDLHTHYSYQVMLPEAIAIVMAPTDSTRTSGIFRLSDPGGVKAIQDCQMRGFHPHEQLPDGSSIYEHSSHVFMSSRLAYQVADLRS